MNSTEHNQTPRLLAACSATRNARHHRLIDVSMHVHAPHHRCRGSPLLYSHLKPESFVLSSTTRKKGASPKMITCHL